MPESKPEPKPFCRTCGFYHDGPCQRWPGRIPACPGCNEDHAAHDVPLWAGA